MILNQHNLGQNKLIYYQNTEGNNKNSLDWSGKFESLTCSQTHQVKSLIIVLAWQKKDIYNL